jgi:uncharacterized protein (UPF0332 family)
VKPEAAQLLAQAARSLAMARHDLAGDFFDGAGRNAYMAMFRSALAYVFERTGRAPKTHSGLRATFNQIARNDGSISPDLAPLLGQGYRYKEQADYAFISAIAKVDAEFMIAKADQFLAEIEAALR